MNAIAFIAVALLAAASPVASSTAAPGTVRTELQRHDLSVSGREGLQARIDFPAGCRGAAPLAPGRGVHLRAE
jgi:hypothetical protein